MGWMILCVVLVLLGVVLLLPLRVTFSVENLNGMRWSVAVLYGFFPIIKKGSEEASSPDKASKKQKADAKRKKASEQQSEPPRQAPPPDSKRERGKAAEEEQADAQADPSPDDDDDSLFRGDSKQESEEKPEKPKKQSLLQKFKPVDLADGKALIDDVLASLSPSLRLLTRHMHFDHIRLLVNVASGDAAKTAVMYGAISGAAFWLLGQLQSRFDFRAEEFRIRSDFLGEKLSFSVSGEYHSTPLSLLAVLLCAGTRFIYRSLRRIRRREREQKAMLKNDGNAKHSTAVG